MTIQDILDKFNLSRSDLANELCIPKRTVQDWALRNRKPPDYVVKLIYEYYKRKDK